MARVNFTAGRVAGFECPEGKAQAFLWDATTPGLALRATRGRDGKPGARAYVFQSEFRSRTLRLTIGSPDAWSIPQAQERARELQRQIDQGRDPREVTAEAAAAADAKREADKRRSVTIAEAWAAYLAERRPHWSERHYADHLNLAHAGGVERSRRGWAPGSRTVAGPLAVFMPLRLNQIDDAMVRAWAAKEAATRPARARLALRLLKAFLRWCGDEAAYKEVTDATAASSKKARELVGTPTRKDDVLQREQLAAWFAAVRQIPSPVICVYLQCLLLTGARREELAGLRWEDVNFLWRGLALRDKVDGSRVTPLTPYVAHLLGSLPRRNEWVFSSVTSESGRLAEPGIAHRQACAVAGLPGLTLHGLRRSFGTLAEWLECPVGVVAQIQGHRPSAIAEKHYRVRPLDLLRVWHERIEAWILEQAGVSFDANAAPASLRVVTR